MQFVLTDVVFARIHAFTEEDVGVEIGEYAGDFRFTRDLALTSGNVDGVTQLTIQLFHLKREVDTIILEYRKLVWANVRYV